MYLLETSAKMSSRISCVKHLHRLVKSRKLPSYKAYAYILQVVTLS